MSTKYRVKIPGKKKYEIFYTAREAINYFISVGGYDNDSSIWRWVNKGCYWVEVEYTPKD